MPCSAAQDRGEVLLAPFDVVLADDTIVQPDLLYVAGSNRGRFRDERLFGAPDLAVEIFRTRTASPDRVSKAKVHARFGVLEYWLVDLDARSVTLLSLDGGAYVPLAHGTGDVALASGILTGFTLRPAEVFSEE